MQKLTLNNGSVLENSHAMISDQNLFIYIMNGFGIMEVFNLMIEPENTKKIIYEAFGETTTFSGFKKLKAVRDEGNGMITVTLRK